MAGLQQKDCRVMPPKLFCPIGDLG